MKHFQLVILSLVPFTTYASSVQGDFVEQDEQVFYLEDDFEEMQDLVVVDEEAEESLPSTERSSIATHPRKDKKLYNPQVRPFPKKGIHLGIEGEFLYWQAHEGDLGYVAQSVEVPFQEEVKDPHFEWNSGFRLGAEYDF